MTFPSLTHQTTALAAARGKPGFMYRMEMGTGKSKCLVDEAVALWRAGEVDRVLVVAPAGSYADWTAKHLPENLPDDVPTVKHLWRGGTTKREKLGLAELLNHHVVSVDASGPRVGYAPAPGTPAPRPPLRWFVVNVEALSTATGPAVRAAYAFVTGGSALVAVDESTAVRNPKAIRTKVVTGLGGHASYRRALTGRAVVRDPLDLWGQLQFLGVERQFATNWYSFRARYCTLKPTWIAGGRQVLTVSGSQNLPELERKLDAVGYRVLKEDCLDLPPKVYARRTVELTPEQRRLYGEMKRTCLAHLDDGSIASTTQVIAQLQKLHGIVIGHLRDEAGELHTVPSNRLAALGEVLEEVEGPVVVWCAYQADIEAVVAHVKAKHPDRRAVHYYGKTPQADREAAVAAFQAGRADVFVSTLATGCRGITLTASSTVVYYSSTFDLEHRLQSEDRVHRVGQTRSCTYVDLIAAGTVEEKIVAALRTKRRVSDAVEGDGARAWLTWEGGE